MKFLIAIDCDNAAFDDLSFAHEIERILWTTAGKLKVQYPTKPEYVHDMVETGPLRDVNGNTVGAWTLDYEGRS